MQTSVLNVSRKKNGARELALSGALENSFFAPVQEASTQGGSFSSAVVPPPDPQPGACRRPVDRELPWIFLPGNISENVHLEISFVSTCQNNSEAVGFSDLLWGRIVSE